MRSFYHYMMTYRGTDPPDDAARLAEWIFKDHDFPKQASDYQTISDYLEWNSPFPNALKVFDELWADYENHLLF